MSIRVVVTGGLTGGHTMPCLTLALALRELGHEVFYIGGANEFEATMAARYDIEFFGFRYVRRGKWRRRLSLADGTVKTLRTLYHLDPDVIFSKGSLTGVPAVIAGRTLGIPIVLHESDIVPGSEIVRMASLCSRICVGFPETATHFRRPTLVTGNLTRPNFSGGSRDACLKRYGLPSDRPVIFITGGSQGAASLNDLIWAILPELIPSCSLIHICGMGKSNPEFTSTGYVQLEFVNDEIKDIYVASDLIVSRAGAGAIEEACAYKVPAIYVPYPWAENNHQELNARVFAAAGVAQVIPQVELTPSRLLEAIRTMLTQCASYADRYSYLVRPNALPLLYEVIFSEGLRRQRGKQ